MVREIKEGINNWRVTLCSWVRIHAIKMPALLSLICLFNTIPITTPANFGGEIYKQIVKQIWSYNEPRIAKITLKKKSNVGGFILLLYFITYYRVIKIVWYSCTDRWVVLSTVK